MQTYKLGEMTRLQNWMRFDRENGGCWIEPTEPFKIVNSKGREWDFTLVFDSDGHSLGFFKHFDAWTPAALCHDLDCIIANKENSYEIRQEGDFWYKHNLKECGAPSSLVYRRYWGVSSYAYTLKLRGKLK
jgi:hypothetical protein